MEATVSIRSGRRSSWFLGHWDPVKTGGLRYSHFTPSHLKVVPTSSTFMGTDVPIENPWTPKALFITQDAIPFSGPLVPLPFPVQGQLMLTKDGWDTVIEITGIDAPVISTSNEEK